jgi:hypothetical protein
MTVLLPTSQADLFQAQQDVCPLLPLSPRRRLPTDELTAPAPFRFA